MQVIEGSRLPIMTWAPTLEPGALEQARNCADLDVAFHHVAVMADGHQGYGVPIGAVLALDAALSPYAVGNDIGCGMIAVPTRIERDDLLAPVTTRAAAAGASARDDIMGWVQSTIPSGRDMHPRAEPSPEIERLAHRAYTAIEEGAALAGCTPTTSQSPQRTDGPPLTEDDFVARALRQTGTLGSGNHFIELLADEESRVWLIIHSGSRGFGGLVCSNFHRMALRAARSLGIDLPDPGLAWLPLDGGGKPWSEIGRRYEIAMRAALDFALHNRRRMAEQAAQAIERHFPDTVDLDGAFDIHHNDATLEQHYGREVWVHRKGAVKAAPGEPTITPGSMGTATYLGRGRGNPQSFSSCSHGAGRVMSRGEAKRRLSLEDELARIRATGGKVFAARKDAVLDEMPGAYKDLDEVMRAQTDLVEVTRRLTPLATYKGIETKDKRSWRPREEQ